MTFNFLKYLLRYSFLLKNDLKSIKKLIISYLKFQISALSLQKNQLK